jgi:DNA-binding XRE family transcriptional regulator
MPAIDLPRLCSCGTECPDAIALARHLSPFADDEATPHLETVLAWDDLLPRGMRRVRMEDGLTMREMAELLEMHASGISRIESGTRGELARSEVCSYVPGYRGGEPLAHVLAVRFGLLASNRTAR